MIRATLDDAAFDAASLPAVAAFDVVEHLEDDLHFLESVRRCLIPGGRFYCTVPALGYLWSDEDVRAGHYRRYTRGTLTDVLRRSGLEIEFVTHIFGWMVPAIFLFRSVPSMFARCVSLGASEKSCIHKEHRLPRLLRRPVHAAHAFEIRCLKKRRSLAVGSSVLCVAKAR